MPPGSRSSHRFFYCLDGIRGIASLLIMVRHTASYFGAITFEESYLGVDIFFLLSGVVIANAYEAKLLGWLPRIQFAKIRIVRIYPLYCLGMMIGLLAIAAGFKKIPHVGEHLSLIVLFALFILPYPSLSAEVGTFPLNGPSWSLFFELVINFIYALTLRFLTLPVLLAIMAGSAVVMVAGEYFSVRHTLDIGFWLKSLPIGFGRVAYSFFAGVLLFRLFSARTHQQALSGGHETLLSWLLLAVITTLLMTSPPEKLRPFYDFIAVTLVFPVTVYAALWLRPSGVSVSLFRFLGYVSYAVYALHQPLGILVQGGLAKIGLAVQNHAPLSGFCFLFFLLALCWIVDKVYDAPIRKHLLSSGPLLPRQG